jgi:hypothetical protein
MDNMIVLIGSLFLVIGVIIGYFGHILKLYIDMINNIKKPLMEISNSDLVKFSFLYRNNNDIGIIYDEDKIIYLDMDAQSIKVFDKRDMILQTHEKFKLEFSLLYSKLLNHFHSEIFLDIIEIDDVIYSRNSFTEEELEELDSYDEDDDYDDDEDDDFIPKHPISPLSFNKFHGLNVDSILDKIGKSGIKSLTPLEKDFLDKHNDK